MIRDDDSAGTRRRVIFGALPSTCLVGLVVFVTVLGAEHVLNPALEPRNHRISEYVNANGGWLMVVGFVGWAAALAATAALAGRNGVAPARIAVATAIALAALGILVVAVFPTQTSAGRLPNGAELTWTGRAHDLGSAAAFLALMFAAAAGALTDPGWRRGTVLGPLVVAGLIVLTFAALDVDAPGIRQRVLTVGAVLWLAAGTSFLGSRRALD